MRCCGLPSMDGGGGGAQDTPSRGKMEDSSTGVQVALWGLMQCPLCCCLQVRSFGVQFEALWAKYR
jgi:hypothetical protein